MIWPPPPLICLCGNVRLSSWVLTAICNSGPFSVWLTLNCVRWLRLLGIWLRDKCHVNLSVCLIQEMQICFLLSSGIGKKLEDIKTNNPKGIFDLLNINSILFLFHYRWYLRFHELYREKLSYLTHPIHTHTLTCCLTFECLFRVNSPHRVGTFAL